MLATVKYMIGSAGPSTYGSRSTAELVTDNCIDLRSYTAIITGATSGIGAETARVLAKRGARLVIPARNLKAAEETKDRIVSEFGDTRIILMSLDLSSLKSVRHFVSEFKVLNLPLNLLINNAGKFSYDHGISEDGIEMHYYRSRLKVRCICTKGAVLHSHQQTSHQIMGRQRVRFTPYPHLFLLTAPFINRTL